MGCASSKPDAKASEPKAERTVERTEGATRLCGPFVTTKRGSGWSRRGGHIGPPRDSSEAARGRPIMPATEAKAERAVARPDEVGQALRHREAWTRLAKQTHAET